MIHYFTYGEDAKRGVFLTAHQADIVNRFTQSFFDAQKTFLAQNGRRWTPEESIRIPFGGEGQLRNPKELDEYNRLTHILNKQYKIRNTFLRRPIREEDMIGDFLVKKF